MIRLVNVGKCFIDGASTRWVLRSLSLDIEPGKSVALIGPSGSGKTTLLNMIAGLLAPDEGEIRVTLNEFDEEVSTTGMSNRELVLYRRNEIGFIYQFFNLVPTLTVSENVLLPVELTKRNHLRQRAMERISQLGLSDLAHGWPEQLSGGEQQRTAIARALAHEPSIVLADEPTGNLDSDNSAVVLEMLWKETKRLGNTLVVATHSNEVCQLADRVIHLN